MDNKENLFIPLDFNSLCNLVGKTIELSDYYVDYAFNSEGIILADGMSVTFYDKYWTPDPEEIICFDGKIKKNSHPIGSWAAELSGNLYASNPAPERKYFSSFIGANTFVAVEGKMSGEQKLGINPSQNKLGGVSVFLFAPDSELPRFSKMVGMKPEEVHDFFQFQSVNLKQPVILPDGQMADDTIVFRGGGNKCEG